MSDGKGFELIADTGTLGRVVDTMRAIVDECIIEFRSDDLYLAAVDPANVAMVEQTIDADAFEHYHAAEMTIGINLDRLSEYLGKVRSPTVELAWNAETRRMDITGEEVELVMAAIDPDTVRDRPDIPDIADDMTTAVTLPADALDHGVGVCDLVSDHVKLETDPGREAEFNMVAEGDIDDARVPFSNSVITGDFGAECHTLLNSSILSSLVGEIPSDAEVLLKHGEEFPIFLEYGYADDAVDVTMMMAPRIQSQ